MGSALRTLVLLLLATDVSSATSDWLAPEVENAIVHRVADRLVEVGVAPDASAEERLEVSRSLVEKIARRVDEWGLEGVLEATPELRSVEFPAVEEPIVSATATYLVCSLASDPARYETDDRKLTVVAAEASVVIVTAFLRDRFLAAGGTDQQLREYLAQPAMMAVLEAMQRDAEMRDSVWWDCGPVFAGILR